jgi:DNA polymerase
MSDDIRTTPAEWAAFSRIAEYLDYQREMGGSPITAQQKHALSALFRERVEQQTTAHSEAGGEQERAAEKPSRQAEASSRPSQVPRADSDRRSRGSKGASQQKKKQKRSGGLPSVEQFRSSETGRLPWERDPEEVAATSSGDKEASEHDEQGTPQTTVSKNERLATSGTSSEQAASVDQAQSETLKDIRNSLGDCTRCRLCEERNNIVFGVGSENARLMFIGEAPGYHEDQQAEPFVGKAGQLLDKMINAMGLKREDVYIANVLKCRPPNNRNPKADEVAHCSPFLKRQILSVDPEVIITLGKFAATFVLGRDLSITRTRGTWQTSYNRSVMPTLHPSYLLRKPEAKRDAWHDLQAVMEKLGLEPPAS